MDKPTKANRAGDNSLLAFDVEKVREDFPILKREIYGRPLVYLDSAASAQKPRQVLDRMQEAYETYYSNVHRGVHSLSQTCTEAFESGRNAAARFINAESPELCVLTKGATEAINLVAHSYGRHFLKAGDEIIISHMEHHSNIVPWQLLRDQIGIVIKVVPIDGDANFLFDEYEKLFTPRTKLVSITHISNAVGTVTPIRDIIRVAHEHGAKVMVDGCQAAPHAIIDVQDLDADFYCFSGHKVYGPSGIGVLYGKRDLLNSMPPYQGGGEMIDLVTFEKTTYKDTPHRFEAGTPAIVEAIGLGAAIEYVEALGKENISAHEHGILAYATERLSRIPGLTIIGRAKEKASILSFIMEEAHAHDIGTILDRRGVAVRAGHHCAQPLMQRFDLPATARASFGIYNTRAEVDALADALEKVRELFS
ncbi:cysteine desulfurase [Kiloniella laminariae]|uniref:cysteine desulfurase n=1 Tax=Kiloniella laminariae TaxID=454162 RepID=A0ABT4LLF9_9PROT|nr:cysteine desulfurase [Kiloniella laminariae]MCZ4281950.1 cysteine desulfurase [Kiloniella laminariae]